MKDKTLTAKSTRIGFFELHNNKKHLITTLDVPFDFAGGPILFEPDDDLSEFGEFEILNPDDGINRPNVEPINPDDYEWPEPDLSGGDSSEPTVPPNENEEIGLLSNIVDELPSPPFNIRIKNYVESTNTYMSLPIFESIDNDLNVLGILDESSNKITLTIVGTEMRENDKWGKIGPNELGIAEGWLSLDSDCIVIIPNKEPDNPIESEPDPDPELEPALMFVSWFRKYFYRRIVKNSKFMSHFNSNKTYVLIIQQNKDIIGLMTIYKGRTELIMNEPGKPIDIVKYINWRYPRIREDLIIKDEEFGGYDEDSGHDLAPDPIDQNFGGYGNDDEYMINDSGNSGEIDTFK